MGTAHLGTNMLMNSRKPISIYNTQKFHEIIYMFTVSQLFEEGIIKINSSMPISYVSKQVHFTNYLFCLSKLFKFKFNEMFINYIFFKLR